MVVVDMLFRISRHFKMRFVKLPLFVVVLLSGFTVWIFLVQQSADILMADSQQQQQHHQLQQQEQQQQQQEQQQQQQQPQQLQQHPFQWPQQQQQQQLQQLQQQQQDGNLPHNRELHILQTSNNQPSSDHQSNSKPNNLPNNQTSQHSTSELSKLQDTDRNPKVNIKIMSHFIPEQSHNNKLEQRLDVALQENELKKQKFKFESVFHNFNQEGDNDNEDNKQTDVDNTGGYHYVPFIMGLPELRSLINPDANLCNDEVTVLIAVSCSIEAFHERQAIRQTWGTMSHNKKLGVRIIFNLAQPAEKWQHLQKDIEIEAATYQDILQWDFVDNEANLTLKSVGLFQWTRANCLSAKFLMKTDHDIFINVPNLLHLLVRFINDDQDKNMMLGYRIDNAKPGQDRNSKWYTSEKIYRDRVYPTYLSGSAYVISSDILGKLFDEARKTPLFWLEDVYVSGILRMKLGSTLRHHKGFWYRKRKGGPCEIRSVITAHELTVEDLYVVWKESQRQDVQCPGSKM